MKLPALEEIKTARQTNQPTDQLTYRRTNQVIVNTSNDLHLQLNKIFDRTVLLRREGTVNDGFIYQDPILLSLTPTPRPRFTSLLAPPAAGRRRTDSLQTPRPGRSSDPPTTASP